MFRFLRRLIEKGRSAGRMDAIDIIPTQAAPSITPSEVKDRIAQAKKVILLDVREEEEIGIAQIDGALHIPMDEVIPRATELDQTSEIVPFDHFGLRGEWTAEQLVRLGFHKVRFMKGGIDAWSREVDPKVPRY